MGEVLTAAKILARSKLNCTTHTAPLAAAEQRGRVEWGRGAQRCSNARPRDTQDAHELHVFSCHVCTVCSAVGCAEFEFVGE